MRLTEFDAKVNLDHDGDSMTWRLYKQDSRNDDHKLALVEMKRANNESN